MLESLAISLLIRSVDFLFEESRKILEERRQRRDNSEMKHREPLSEKDIDNTSRLEEEGNEDKKETNLSKDDILKLSVSIPLWKGVEKKIKGLIDEADIHLENYHRLREQYAAYGKYDVPLIIVNRLANEENELLVITKELEKILSKIYNQKISVTDNKD